MLSLRDILDDTGSASAKNGVGNMKITITKDLDKAQEELEFTVKIAPSFATANARLAQSYKKRVKELSEVIGLGNELFNTIKTFSGGMKRKLEIIRSLMHKPKVLFLDEPTIGLDPLSRKNLWEYLKTVRKQQNITIFLTTHYLEEAEEADTVCIISKGKIVSLGTPTQIKNTLIDEYILIDADNRNKLTKELESKKIKFTGNGPFKIDIENKNLQKLIQDIKTPLSMLKTHSPTLEEAYLEIIAERENNLSS